MDGFILYRVRENGNPAPPMSTLEEYGTRKEMWGARDGALVRALASHQCGPGSNPGFYLSIIIYLFFFFYGTHRNQSTFYLDDEERKSRGSRRLKYGSSDKDYDEDEKDGAAAFDLDGDDDDNDDDGCDDNYDDESEDEEEGSERQPKGKLSK